MNGVHAAESGKVDKCCPRCEGLLVSVRMESDPYDSSEPLFLRMWRCVSCGTMLDSKILRNQTLTRLNSLSGDTPIPAVVERKGRRRAKFLYSRFPTQDE